MTPSAIAQVLILNLQKGIENSLDAKLDSAIQSLDDVNQINDVAAVNSLEAFINAVEAQSGNKISVVDANSLIAAAQQIINNLLGIICHRLKVSHSTIISSAWDE